MLKSNSKLFIALGVSVLLAGCAPLAISPAGPTRSSIRPITAGERILLMSGGVPAPKRPWGILMDFTTRLPNVNGNLTVLSTGEYSVVAASPDFLFFSAPGPIGIGPWTGNEMIFVYSKWLDSNQLDEYKSVEEIKTRAKNKTLELYGGVPKSLSLGGAQQIAREYVGGATDMKEISMEYEDILKFWKGKMFALAYKAGGRYYRVVHAFTIVQGPKPDSHVLHDFSYIRMEKPGMQDHFDDFVTMLKSLDLQSATANPVVVTIRVAELPIGLAVNQKANRVYVANYKSRTISVIDAGTNAIAATVALEAAPHGVVITPDGTRAYVTQFSADSVLVLDAATNKPIATVPVSKSPIRVTLTPDGKKAYVTNFHSNKVSVIDTSSNRVTATIELGAEPFPFGVAISPNGSRAYVANARRNTVSVINTATNQIVGTVEVGARPNGIAITPDGSRVYVANGESHTISVIDTALNQVITTIAAGTEPAGLAVAPDGKRVYVANARSESLSVIDTSSNQVVDTVYVGEAPQQVAISPDGTRAYVTNGGSNTVSVIDIFVRPERQPLGQKSLSR